jgi:periplasmic protein TonB
MTPQQETRKNVKAAFGTAGVCVVVFLLLLLTSAWKTAGSGDGDYPGIEVNLGFDDQGSGNDQPQTEPGDPDAKDTENPPVEENSNEEQKIASAEPTPSENVKIVQPTTVTDPNSDVEIKDETKEVKPEEKTAEKKTTAEPIEKKPVEKPKVVDKNAVYTGKKTTTTGQTPGEGDGKQGSTGNEGDDEGKTGDKGVPGGKEGAAVYKGRPGGGDGSFGLDMNGCACASQPKPVPIPDNESGFVIFEISVDKEGDIFDIDVIESTLSASAVSICKAEIQKAALMRKIRGQIPDVSKGKVMYRHTVK